MARLRLRTQLFVASLLIISALLGSLLVVVHHIVRSEIVEGVRQRADSSLHAFENVQHERELELSRTAAMLAELPPLKAVLSTQHALTIQDASEPFWKLAGSQLFVLFSPDGKVFGFHASGSGWDASLAEAELKKSVEQGEYAAWWYGDGRLYRVFLHSILAGSGNNQREVGIIAVGYQIDSAVAAQLSLASGSQIVLAIDDKIIASTLSPREEQDLQGKMRQDWDTSAGSREVLLGGNAYQAATALLYESPATNVKCYVLMSLQPANALLARLNRTILIVGFSAIVLATLLLSFVSSTITHPLDNLVAGVRALAQGDYAYSINLRGSSEVAELGKAFSKMRGELLISEQRRFASERIAALGRAASSISHDLRHYLAAVVANAEFLYEADELKLDKSEIYQEIKTASTQMTDLIDSLRELAHQRTAISPEVTNLEQVLHRAIEAVKVRPEFRNRAIKLIVDDDLEGLFDPRKLERAFFNLVLNACEATPDGEHRVIVEVRTNKDAFEIRVSDEGSGVPDNIRGRVFDPFVSSGKPNGTGLGLAIVSKIVGDHGGSVSVERTSETGTVMLVKLPRTANSVASHSDSAFA